MATVNESITIFKGATKLNYSGLIMVETNDNIVNQADFDMEADANVTTGSVIDFKKSDESTTIFSAKVKEIKELFMWGVNAKTNGYELLNTRVEQVYTNVSPEFIVQDVIDNYTVNLTYDSTYASGIVLDKYIAQAYGIDVILDMMTMINARLRIDYLDNATFEEKGGVNNGRTFTNGTDIDLTNWDTDEDAMCNHVRVIGGFENIETSQTVTGVGTTFTLSHKPAGTFIAFTNDGGTEISPEDYTVNADESQVVFTNSQTNPFFEYSYNRPVVVEYQDDDSINSSAGEIFREISAPWLNTRTVALQYARSYVDERKNPLETVMGTEPGLNFDILPNEIIVVDDPVRGKTAQEMVVTVIRRRPAEGVTEYEMGPRLSVYYDWAAEVQDRIKKIERRITNEDDISFARFFAHLMNTELTLTLTQQYASPNNSALTDHITLGIVRADRNTEPDCARNSNTGTWSGTGIGGSQYVSDGARLHAGNFNGSDRKITVSDDSSIDLTSDFTIGFWVRVTPLPGAEKYLLNKWDGIDGYACRITASNTVELLYSALGVPNTIATTSALTNNVWHHIAFVKSGTDLIAYFDGVSDNTDTGAASAGFNSNDLVIGNYSTNWFDGDLDELRIYDDVVSAANILDIKNKEQYLADLVCYLAMDDPVTDDNWGSKVNIT